MFESEPALAKTPAGSPPGRSVDRSAGPYLLFGPLGLRAGWGILLYFIVAALLGTGLFFAIADGTGRLAQIRTETAETRASAKQQSATSSAPVPSLSLPRPGRCCLLASC